MTRAADLAELGSAYAGVNPLAFRNKLVNGDMRIQPASSGANGAKPSRWHG